jgi:hypothetical protein
MDENSEDEFEEKAIEDASTFSPPHKKSLDETVKPAIAFSLNDDKSSQALSKADYSLKPDIDMGYKPNIDVPGAPIPLTFDMEDNTYWRAIGNLPVVYYGFRPKDTFEMHESLGKNYPFKMSEKLFALIKEVNMCNKV